MQRLLLGLACSAATAASLRSSARPSAALALTAADVADTRQAVKLLGTSPVSCVRLDDSHVAHFSIAPSDVYDPRELLEAGGPGPDASAMRLHGGAKQWSCKEPNTAPAAILVATYVKHQSMYNRLVQSVHRNILGNSTPFISVFSSIQESTEMTSSCPACSSTAALEMRSLVFNYDYHDHIVNLKKANYQTAKKLWALDHVAHSNVLMLDSDFAILRPIVLADAIAPYEHVSYDVPLNAFTTGIFPNMLRRLKNLFNASEPLGVVSFEPPWIYNKSQVTNLMAYLARVWTDGYVETLLNEDDRVFEVLLYRVFILVKDPGFFSQHISTGKLWFEDAHSEITERQSMSPPPVTVKHWQQNRNPCDICWLESHGDRGED